ncbi:MAG: DNA-directed RNA polymerase subunit omega [Phycisphaerales bacterium]
MIEALKSDTIVNKVGGKFKLCALIQKRVVQLMDGARPLVERNGRSDLEVAIDEILQEKITFHAPTAQELASGAAEREPEGALL